MFLQIIKMYYLDLLLHHQPRLEGNIRTKPQLPGDGAFQLSIRSSITGSHSCGRVRIFSSTHKKIRIQIKQAGIHCGHTQLHATTTVTRRQRDRQHILCKDTAEGHFELLVWCQREANAGIIGEELLSGRLSEPPDKLAYRTADNNKFTIAEWHRLC